MVVSLARTDRQMRDRWGMPEAAEDRRAGHQDHARHDRHEPRRLERQHARGYPDDVAENHHAYKYAGQSAGEPNDTSGVPGDRARDSAATPPSRSTAPMISAARSCWRDSGTARASAKIRFVASSGSARDRSR